MTYIIILILIILIIGFVIYLKSCSKNSKNIEQTTDDQQMNSKKIRKTSVQENRYSKYREMALSVTPEQLELKLDDNKIYVYGIIMDWDINGNVATVVAFQTGDASLYLSSGQIIIGGYAHENIKSAALNFVNEGQKYIKTAIQTDETPLPDKNCVRFYFLTNKGKFYLQDTMENFENQKSDLMPLFELGNRVITEYRIITEKK